MLETIDVILVVGTEKRNKRTVPMFLVRQNIANKL